jgi:hypothetical protein
MRLKSLLSLGVAVACLIALAPAEDAFGATASHPTIVTTTPSAAIGGLPITGLDGGTEYIPAHAAAPQALQARAAQGLGSGDTGYDISWPECGGAMPPASSIAIVGVDGGHPFSQNPCLQQETAWAQSAKTRAQYMVLDSPIGFTSPHVLEYAYHGPAGDCTASDYLCQTFNWGWNAAGADLQNAAAGGATSDQWWLDIELPTQSSINPSGPHCYDPNFWICDQKLNSVVVIAATAALTAHGKHVGVYSTKQQWQAITGGLGLGLPTWIAGYDYAPGTYCSFENASRYWFDAAEPAFVQSLPATFDPDTAC